MKKILLTCFFIVLFLACNKGDDLSDEALILKHVIIRYNTLLADGYRSLNMTGLLEAATPERAQKAYYHMSALGEGREKMDAKLDNISFLDVTMIPPDKASVKTQETWNYTHINIDTNEVVLNDSIMYELSYKLVKHEDKWLVSDIEVIREESSGSPVGK